MLFFPGWGGGFSPIMGVGGFPQWSFLERRWEVLRRSSVSGKFKRTSGGKWILTEGRQEELRTSSLGRKLERTSVGWKLGKTSIFLIFLQSWDVLWSSSVGRKLEKTSIGKNLKRTTAGNQNFADRLKSDCTSVLQTNPVMSPAPSLSPSQYGTGPPDAPWAYGCGKNVLLWSDQV